jgi:hypothetical protein
MKETGGNGMTERPKRSSLDGKSLAALEPTHLPRDTRVDVQVVCKDGDDVDFKFAEGVPLKSPTEVYLSGTQYEAGAETPSAGYFSLTSEEVRDAREKLVEAQSYNDRIDFRMAEDAEKGGNEVADRLKDAIEDLGPGLSIAPLSIFKLTPEELESREQREDLLDRSLGLTFLKENGLFKDLGVTPDDVSSVQLITDLTYPEDQ